VKVSGTNPSRNVGLARALSKLGHCSRSEGVELIHAGRVRLNGAVRRDPEAPVRLESGQIEVDGRPIGKAARIYLALNKPRGVVTTASDEKGRRTVYEFLDSTLPWIASVGRLDKASEGLLLLTNDSEWAGHILAPASHLDKTYHVQIDRVADAKLVQSIERGVKTAEGDFLRVNSVRILRGGERNTWLEIGLDEGRNRHIRRILESLGPLLLGQLAKGKVRSLTREEKGALDRAMHIESKKARSKSL